jgi:hypothetical protein
MQIRLVLELRCLSTSKNHLIHPLLHSKNQLIDLFKANIIPLVNYALAKLFLIMKYVSLKPLL